MTTIETLASRQASAPLAPTTPASAFTCIGRSAWPNAPIAISTPMCARRRSTKSASSPPCAPNSPIAPRLTPGRAVRSIFFGGGTPSLMRPQTVQSVIDAVGGRLERSTPTPRSRSRPIRPASRPGASAAIAPPGVNRLSIGVQALDDADLKALGRRHDVAEAIEAVKIAASIFPRYSFDLIYARPGQSEAAWRAELAEAMTLAGEHLSLYQLTIEPDTIFERLWRAGKLAMPDEELAPRPVRRDPGDRRGARPARLRSLQPRAARRREPAQSRLLALRRIRRGRPGRARPPPRAATAAAPRRPRSIPEMWLTQVESEGHGLIENAPLSAEEQGDEFLLMGLRLREGDRSRALRGAERPRRCSRRQIDDLVAEGFIEEDAQRPHPRDAASGMPLLDSIVADLAA